MKLNIFDKKMFYGYENYWIELSKDNGKTELDQKYEAELLYELFLLREFAEIDIVRNSIPNLSNSFIGSKAQYEGTGVGFHLNYSDAEYFCNRDYNAILAAHPTWWSPGLTISCAFDGLGCMCTANFYSGSIMVSHFNNYYNVLEASNECSQAIIADFPNYSSDDTSISSIDSLVKTGFANYSWDFAFWNFNGYSLSENGLGIPYGNFDAAISGFRNCNSVSSLANSLASETFTLNDEYFNLNENINFINNFFTLVGNSDLSNQAGFQNFIENANDLLIQIAENDQSTNYQYAISLIEVNYFMKIYYNWIDVLNEIYTDENLVRQMALNNSKTAVVLGAFTVNANTDILSDIILRGLL